MIAQEVVAEQFRAAICDAGLHPPEVIEVDGRLHRFASNGRRNDDAGWYVFYGDGIPAGAFGDWRTGSSKTWHADIRRRLSPEEKIAHRARIGAIRRERAAEDAGRKAEARRKAAAIWQSAPPAPDDHPYLIRKGVKAYGLRAHDGTLVIPMREGAELHSLQFISVDGNKRFLDGGRVGGCYFSIGQPDDMLCIAEGYATGASIREATGYAVAVAFNAGNLLPVARTLRAKFPALRLVVCADDDAATPGNPGLTKAREAAQAVGGLLAVPEFGAGRPQDATDFNDLALQAGPEAVRACIERAKPVESGSDAAEKVRDPLDGLVKLTGTDPGAAFAPEVLERLVALKRGDRAAFEALRAQLKTAGCRVTALDEAIAEESGEVRGRGPTQADIMIDLAKTAELFHGSDGTGFADLNINGHRETWPIRTKGFRRWLARRFFEATGGAPSSEALQSVLNVIEARAHFDASERRVYVRVGGLDGRLYLDLGDEKWRVVEIDAAGWRVIDNPPIRFRRAAGMQALPVPMVGGSVEALRPYLNVKTDADFVLAIAWLLASLRNRGPYPVMALSGEQGSAKSTFSAILRALLDPNTASLRALPREDRDLFIAASNGHVLAFDNVSGLPAWISDTLCRLATGGGFAVRQLYTDQDETLFNGQRPIILNGIEDVVTRPDLADRSLFLTLEPIPEKRRKPEAELWAEFETERPRVLGALLDAVAKGLAVLPQTKLDTLPRMADFALWATACEAALWPAAGTFMAAYCGNRDEAVESVIEGDPIAAAVRALMAARTDWTGAASELLGALAEQVGERLPKTKTWPDSPRALSGRLRRAATFLRKVGIEIDFKREGHMRTRTISITKATADPAPESSGAQPSAPSASSAPTPKSSSANGFVASDPRTVANAADGRGNEPVETVRANPLKGNSEDGADAADANSTPQAAPGNPRRSARL